MFLSEKKKKHINTLPLTGGTSGNQCAVTGMDAASKGQQRQDGFLKAVAQVHRVTVLSLKCAAFTAFPIAETAHLETAA